MVTGVSLTCSFNSVLDLLYDNSWYLHLQAVNTDNSRHLTDNFTNLKHKKNFNWALKTTTGSDIQWLILKFLELVIKTAHEA